MFNAFCIHCKRFIVNSIHYPVNQKQTQHLQSFFTTEKLCHFLFLSITICKYCLFSIGDLSSEHWRKTRVPTLIVTRAVWPPCFKITIMKKIHLAQINVVRHYSAQSTLCSLIRFLSQYRFYFLPCGLWRAVAAQVASAPQLYMDPCWNVGACIQAYSCCCCQVAQSVQAARTVNSPLGFKVCVSGGVTPNAIPIYWQQDLLLIPVL